MGVSCSDGAWVDKFKPRIESGQRLAPAGPAAADQEGRGAQLPAKRKGSSKRRTPRDAPLRDNIVSYGCICRRAVGFSAIGAEGPSIDAVWFLGNVFVTMN